MANGNNAKLPSPRTLTNEPLYTLESTIRSQFRRVVLLDENGDEVAILVDADNSGDEAKVGSANFDYVCGLLIGATGGRGNLPDGAAMWVAENRAEMEHLDKYTLKAVPDSRGTILEAPVPAFMDIVRARHSVLAPSLEKYPPEKKVRETVVENEEEEIDIQL